MASGHLVSFILGIGCFSKANYLVTASHGLYIQVEIITLILLCLPLRPTLQLGQSSQTLHYSRDFPKCL